MNKSFLKNTKNAAKGIIAAVLFSLGSYQLSADDAVNLMSNPGAETLVPAGEAIKAFHLGYFLGQEAVELTDEVPEGWGLYLSADAQVEWGATDKEAHSGKYSCFMKLIDPLNSNKNWLYERMLLGKGGNGGKGAKAIKVTPKTKYTYSFWVKGDIKKFCVEMVTWSADGKVKFSYTANKKEKVGAKWRQVTGSHKTLSSANTMAISIRILSAEAGQTIYVDDVVIAVAAK